MNNKKAITMPEYQKKMDKIIKKVLPPHETLMLMLEEARQYKIK